MRKSTTNSSICEEFSPTLRNDMRCATCGADVAANALHGLCPVCLLDSAFADTPAPSTFSYDLIEEIGRGGMAIVYRALQRSSNRQVALKMILAEQATTPGMLDRFRAEAEAIGALDHPNILPLYDAGELDGTPFYSMKLATGGTLREHIARFVGRPREAATLVATIAGAVQHAHDRGILHRDLKPGNILLDGDSDTPFVADFGLAKWLARDNRLTIAPTALGTPHYIAPEQASGESKKLTGTVDVYSLGAILYELLVGQPPFAGDTPLDVLRLVSTAQATAPRALNSAVPRDLERICLKCLQKEPRARYHTPGDLADDLDRWGTGRPITARRATPFERGWRWTKRNPALALGTAAAVVSAAVAFGAVQHYRRAAPAVVTQGPIAVLPFRDQSPAHDQQIICDGLADELRDELSRVPSLRVIGRTSASALRGDSITPRDVRSKVGAATLLEGSVQPEGNRLHIHTALLATADARQLWSKDYVISPDRLPTMRQTLTQELLQAVGIAAPPAAKEASSHDAYEFYLRGVYFSNKSDEEDLRKALVMFQRALDLDPSFGRAWTGVAKTWDWLADAFEKPSVALPAVRAAAAKALQLDTTDAEARCYFGETKRVLDWDIDAEERELRQAILTDEDSSTAHMFLALVRMSKGDAVEALQEIERAKQADPLSAIISNFAVAIDLGAGHSDEAIAEGKRTYALDADYFYFAVPLGAAYLEKGNYDEALRLYQRAAELQHAPMPGLVITYARLGRRGDAIAALNEIVAAARSHYVSGDSMAAAYVALGDKDAAFHELDRAFAEHSGTLHAVAFDPLMAPLHGDPRFAELLKRIGLRR